ncbi:hypothetical protein IMSAGC020_02447 [Lachnospiraceae bacterium]|nr:hypothetical protein IMSAGC020_02447 [Lachnospiraceae bacterium]
MSASCSIDFCGCSLFDKERLRLFYERGELMNGYLKISEISEKWGIKERRINTLCLEGRIEGAIKFGNTWAIPEDAEKPKDERIKSGKYIKTPNEA